MNEDIFGKVKKIIVEQSYGKIETDKVLPNSRFIEDLGADSLQTIELVMKLEEEFDIEIDDNQAQKFLTVQDVVDFIQTKA